MATAQREEVVNSRLAYLLERRGTHARAETIVRTGRSRSLPDVIVDWLGVRIVIECKYEAPGVGVELQTQVEARLDAALGDVGVALMYPVPLRTTLDLDSALADAQLRARFIAPGRLGQWITLHGVDGLANALDQARAILIDDDAVNAAAARLTEAITLFERAVMRQPGRLDAIFGVVAASDAATAGGPTPRAKRAAAAIAGLAVCTAAMLQAELSKVDASVPKLPSLNGRDRRLTLLTSWRKVLEHDYAAIFGVGAGVLDALQDDDALETALGIVERTARRIASQRILGRHDLVGRVYHTLLSDQKYLATYFTSVPAATLLCHLAIDKASWPDADWAIAPEAGIPLTVADLACGTGTLLTSAVGVMRQVWATARATAHQPVDQEAFGKRAMEDGAWGFDVLSYALQICASTMLLGSPGTTVDSTRLHKMPFGGLGGRLGSLELLTDYASAQLWGDDPGELLSFETAEQVEIALPQVDLVVMNPPFTRSVGGSQLLGSLENAEFTTARRRLRELVNRPDVSANLTAGLGAPFVDLATRAVRHGGRLALVLPKSVLTGEAWEPTRRLLATRFHLELVISAHEADHWNFSDSTQLSEALLIARRRDSDNSLQDKRTTWIALRRNPNTVVEALGAASAIRRVIPASEHGDVLRISDDLDGEIGEAFSRPAPSSGKPWRHATFSREILDRTLEALLDLKTVPLPGGSSVDLPLRALSEIATIGYDRRDITDAFEQVNESVGYPALWGQDPQKMLWMAAESNSELRPRTRPAPGRTRIKPADQVWAGAGRLMIVERLWTITYRVIGVVVPSRAVSNTWWSINLHEDDPTVERALALWLNSTLGLASFVAAAEETRGPWMAIKKNKLKTLPLLDTATLEDSILQDLAAAWDNHSESELQPISKLQDDPVRINIDAAISRALGIPEEGLSRLRSLLSAEPRINPVVQPKSEPEAAPPGLSLF